MNNEAFHLPDGSVTKDSAIAAEEWAKKAFELRDTLEKVVNVLHLQAWNEGDEKIIEEAKNALDNCPRTII